MLFKKLESRKKTYKYVKSIKNFERLRADPRLKFEIGKSYIYN